MTVGAALLVLTSVLAPFDLYEEISPSNPQAVEFRCVRDPSPWGSITMPRPDFKFGRYCEWGRYLSCSARFQGVTMQEIEPAVWQSVREDPASTINTTIPVNFTAMLSSVNTAAGNTITGLLDI